MASLKVILGLNDGKSIQKELSEENSANLLGKKLGDKVPGDLIGFKDYEFEVTGGSDNCGFPMRKDVQGAGRKRILSLKGTVGVQGWWSYKKGGKVFTKRLSKGIRIRKTVCGNTINDKTSQVNLKVLKAGAPLEANKEAPAEKN
ncbi:30S ribosomal protein S6e [archaeon]|nr:30S ribosomal protein S6e [archaeon]